MLRVLPANDECVPPPPLLSVREQWGGRPIARKVQYQQEYSKAKTLGRPRNCVAADRGGNATASKSNRQDDVAVIPQIRFSVRLSASRCDTPPAYGRPPYASFEGGWGKPLGQGRRPVTGQGSRPVSQAARSSAAR